MQPTTAPEVTLRLRLRLPVIWLLLLLAAALILPDRVWNTLLIGLGGLFVVAYFWARALTHSLTATRRLRFSWVSVGDRLEEEFVIRNDSNVPALWIEVVDFSSVPDYRAGVVRSIGSKGVDRWRQASICQRRGQFTLGPWTTYSGDPFGIFQVVHHYPVSDEIIIHPPIHGQLPIPLPSGQSSGLLRVQRQSWIVATNAAGVRDYHPEDSLHLIHWPTSARKDGLYVRQFDLDAAGDIWLLLDLNKTAQLGQGAEGTEEHGVLLAAALAARAIKQNRAVGLAAYGQAPQILLPGKGQGQQWKILRSLALVSSDGEADLERTVQDLSQIARRGTTAVIITATDSLDWIPGLLSLVKRGVQSSVILLDRPSFGGQGNSAGMMGAIRRHGFTSYIVRQGEIGRPLETPSRRGFWEFQVTGTGRVITLESPWAGKLDQSEGQIGKLDGEHPVG